MHRPDSMQENEALTVFWDFEIQTDYLTSTQRPDLLITDKKKTQKKKTAI